MSGQLQSLPAPGWRPGHPPTIQLCVIHVFLPILLPPSSGISKEWVEARSAASSWEDVENLGNFKRPSLPESTPTGTEEDPKVEDSGTRTAVALLSNQAGIDPPLPLEQICTFVLFFFKSTFFSDRMNASVLLCAG